MYPETDRRALKKVWAHRPKWGGDSLTKNNDVEELRPQITELFNVGSASKSQKISSARMQNMLEVLHPSRYDITSEQQITSIITSLVKKEKEVRMAAAQKRLEEEQEKKRLEVAKKKLEEEKKKQGSTDPNSIRRADGNEDIDSSSLPTAPSECRPIRSSAKYQMLIM